MEIFYLLSNCELLSKNQWFHRHICCTDLWHCQKIYWDMENYMIFYIIVNSLISVHSPLTPGWITTYIRRPRTISGKSVTGRLFSSDRFVRRNPARLHQAASGNGGKAKTALRWSPVSARSPSFRIWTIWRWSQQRQMSTRCHLVLRRKKSLPPWRSTVIPINGK